MPVLCKQRCSTPDDCQNNANSRLGSQNLAQYMIVVQKSRPVRKVSNIITDVILIEFVVPHLWA